MGFFDLFKKKTTEPEPGPTCPACGHPILEDREFCGFCGENLEKEANPPPENERSPATAESTTRACPFCNHENIAGAQFCRVCGSSLRQA